MERERGGHKVGGGVDFLGGNKNPGVKGLSRGYKTSGVNPEGGGFPGGDRRGQGVDENSPATQEK